MKKLIMILLIGLLPILVFSQTTTTDSKNWKHTGTNQFTKTINVNGQNLTNTKIAVWDATSVEINDTIALYEVVYIPTIFTVAGDTSNYPTPGKAGNIFIDTNASKVYISKSATRNGWLKLN